MFGFFAWIRQQVKAAVLSGLNDAAAELGETFDPAEAQRLLSQRLQALPPPAAPDPAENGHAEEPVGTRRRGGK